jgi:lysyl-tRNA synthetase class 2
MSPELVAALQRVSDVHIGGQTERGFSMAMDDMWAPEHGDCVFAIALAPDGRPAGFVYYVPVPRAAGLSLAAMRRVSDAPNGTMEYLICETLAWARAHGIDRVSLNFNAFGEILRSDVEDPQTPRWRGPAKAFLRRADRYFQVERQLAFNEKFFPAWEPRFAAYERRSDLPLAAIVLLFAESLIELPHLPRRRTAGQPALPASDAQEAFTTRPAGT